MTQKVEYIMYQHLYECRAVWFKSVRIWEGRVSSAHIFRLLDSKHFVCVRVCCAERIVSRERDVYVDRGNSQRDWKIFLRHQIKSDKHFPFSQPEMKWLQNYI